MITKTKETLEGKTVQINVRDEDWVNCSLEALKTFPIKPILSEIALSAHGIRAPRFNSVPGVPEKTKDIQILRYEQLCRTYGVIPNSHEYLEGHVGGIQLNSSSYSADLAHVLRGGEKIHFISTKLYGKKPYENFVMEYLGEFTKQGYQICDRTRLLISEKEIVGFDTPGTKVEFSAEQTPPVPRGLKLTIEKSHAMEEKRIMAWCHYIGAKYHCMPK